jgi:hypothetical protein
VVLLSLSAMQLSRGGYIDDCSEDLFALDLPQPETSATDAGSSALSGELWAEVGDGMKG